MQQPTEIRRAVAEAVRVVRIPYARAFSGDSNVEEIARVGMASDTVVNRRVIRIRLTTHDNKRQAGGMTHPEEFAAAFGYLDLVGVTCRKGKFALAEQYVRHRAEGGGYFDTQRATLGLRMYALLEKHGDMVLPVLKALEESPSPGRMADEAVRIFRNTLALRYRQLNSPELPRNQAHHALREELARYLLEWDVEKSRNHPRPASAAKILEPKTRLAYPSRTYAYLAEIGAVADGSGHGRSLTSLGLALVAALKREALNHEDESAQLPPTFEAIHDGFSITWEKYVSIFAPPVAQGSFERVVQSALLPSNPPSGWREEELSLKDELPDVVAQVGDSLTRSARIDIVRLALFLGRLGSGRPIILDDSHELRSDPLKNGVSQILLDEPRRYMVGHSRSGQRLWSVALVRR